MQENLEDVQYLKPLRSTCEEQFRSLYGYAPQRSFFSPGRINIIGDHIDYNGGSVFPCAIELGTFASVGLRRDRKLRLYSHNFPEQAPREFSFSEFEYRKEYNWCNYVLGMADVLNKELGAELALPDSLALGLDLWQGQGIGLDIVFYGNLPSGGSGLSSSASIEVLMGYILLSYSRTGLNTASWTRERLAVLAQRAENEFCGMHCGIMDQFVIAVAQQNRACLLDCATLNYEQVPLNFTSSDAAKKPSHAFLIANTKLPRKLQDSKYNQRRAECEEALAQIQAQQHEQNKNLSAKENLCAISADELPAALALLKGHDVLLRRTRHAVSEHGRTVAAAAAMKAKNWPALARLMSESHASLRDDYDVSGEHLDTLVSLLHEVDGVLGARMTGAGFSGCAVALLDLAAFEKQKGAQQLEALAQKYEQKFSWRPEFYRSKVVAGVRELI